jgi:hypothetical protein
MTESRIKTYIKTRLRAPPEGLVLRWAKKSKVHRPPAENQHNIIWVYFLGGGFNVLSCFSVFKKPGFTAFLPSPTRFIFLIGFFHFLLDPA